MAGWLGLDVGTSSSKALVYDEATGAPLATGHRSTSWTSTSDGVETTADAVVEGALGVVRAALAALPDGVTVGGIGITSMGESGILVDAHRRPVAPVIAWHDGRDSREVEQLREDIGEDAFGARAGKPLRGQFSVTKHRWLLRHVPDAVRAVRRFNIAEWVALALGAQEACERTLACRTGWFDVAAGRWWDEALAWSGTSQALMPPLVDAGTAIGRVGDAALARRLHGAVITLAGHDHQAAALGARATRAGDELDSSGTAEALVRTVPQDLSGAQILALARDGVTTDVSLRPGHFSLLGGTEGGLAMQRALGLLGVARAQLPELDRLALAAPTGRVTVSTTRRDGLALSGITDGVGPAEIWRAVVEAVTADAVRLHESISAVVGPHERLVAAGGWCNSALVMHVKRQEFGPIAVAGTAESGTFGAAVLAARAAGVLRDDEYLGGASRTSPVDSRAAGAGDE